MSAAITSYFKIGLYLGSAKNAYFRCGTEEKNNKNIHKISNHLDLTFIRYIGGPESFVRGVDLDVVIVLPQALVPLQHKVSDAVRFLNIVLTVHVR